MWAWQPTLRRTVVYAGDPAGKSYLEAAGLSVDTVDGGSLTSNQVLVAGPGSGKVLAKNASAIYASLKTGGNLLAIGLDESDIGAWLPVQITFKRAEHISADFEPFGLSSLMAGVGPSDVHNRDPRQLALVVAGGKIVGDGVLALGTNINSVFCQMAPWQFANTNQPSFKRTFRRTSFLVCRLLSNLGVEQPTPLIERFRTPVEPAQSERRWLTGLYVDQPEEWDDPYRFFRW